MLAWPLQTLCLLVVLLTTQAVALASLPNKPDNATVDCPVGFFVLGTSCYYFSGDNTSIFYDASEICKSMRPVGDSGSVDLAGLGDGDEEFSHVADFVLNVGVQRMFVGLTGPGADDDWHWFDGSILPLYSSMWSCIDPVYTAGGLIIDKYELAPRVYISSFDILTAHASYLCEYTPPITADKQV